MDVGGSDIVLDVPPGAPIEDIILRSARFLWPNGCFQGIEDVECFDLAVAGTRRFGGGELFIYRGRDAYLAWEAEGATEANLETMLYFILGEAPASRRRITVVCGSRTTEIARFLEGLQASFLNNSIEERQAA